MLRTKLRYRFRRLEIRAGVEPVLRPVLTVSARAASLLIAAGKGIRALRGDKPSLRIAHYFSKSRGEAGFSMLRWTVPRRPYLALNVKSLIKTLLQPLLGLVFLIRHIGFSTSRSGCSYGGIPNHA